MKLGSMWMIKWLSLLLLMLIFAPPTPAFADDGDGVGEAGIRISFDGLTGRNGDPLTIYRKNIDVIVRPESGAWFQGQLVGDPVPSIFASIHFGSPHTTGIVVDVPLLRFVGLD